MVLLILLPLLLHLIYSQERLHFSMLNHQQTISLALQNYFMNPAQVQIDYLNSTQQIDQIMQINLTKKPVQSISSMSMTANLTNSTTVDFDTYNFIMQRSIFNHPNKIFLMSNNTIFSVRYQVSPSDNHSYVQAMQINPNTSSIKCQNIQVKQFNTSYYLFVACLNNKNNSALVYLYQFVQNGSSYLDSLMFVDMLNTDISASCNKVALYAFDTLAMERRIYQNRVLLFCSSISNPIVSLNKTYILYPVVDSKNNTRIAAQRVTDYNLFTCLRNTNQILPYQKGFLSLSDPYLKYYAYDNNSQSSCTSTFLNVRHQKFIASVQQRSIQYVYVIFDDHIIIKQSYSPNYQLINIDTSIIQGLQLVDYSIARKIMALLYQNDTAYFLLTFDLHDNTPKLVDIIHYQRNYTFLHLYSVHNYLESGNYFLTYNAQQNLLNLNIYLGYPLTVSIKNNSRALGQLTLVLGNQAGEKLEIIMGVREFGQMDLVRADRGDQVLVVEDVLVMQLQNYIIGPLGQYYKYPSQTSLQYLNHYSTLQLTTKLSPLPSLSTFSINNLLSKPILTFFSFTTVLTCQLDFNHTIQQPQIQQCKQSHTKKSHIQTPIQIIVVDQESYLQYDGKYVQMCQLGTNGEYQCGDLLFKFQSDFKGVKINKYSYSQKEQNIQIIVFGDKQIAYCQLHRQYPSKIFTISVNYLISQKDLPQLQTMSITSLKYDEQYTHYLILQFRNDVQTEIQKIVVYDKPYILQNSYSNFIGHVMEVFEWEAIEGYFCVGSLLVVMGKEKDKGEEVVIREYKISKEYRVKFTRMYPLYGFKVKKGGNHQQNMNFIYVQTVINSTSYYLVYAPLLPSSNLLVHRIKKQQSILFSQQISPIMNSSLLLRNNHTLIGLTLPSLIFQHTRPASHNVNNQGVIYQRFNLSVIDSMNRAKVLSYDYSFNELQGQISYLGTPQINITLDASTHEQYLQIQWQKIIGIIADYNLIFPQSPQCQSLKTERNDIFTKQQCLLYHQSLLYGTISDFLAITYNSQPIQIIVTDISLFCLNKRTLPKITDYNFINLTDCKFNTNQHDVIMACINTTTLTRQIFGIELEIQDDRCQVKYSGVEIPGEFGYQDYDVMFADGFIVFQVPIRLEQHKIYYKTQYNNNTIDPTYSLLRKQQKQGIFQTQFNTVDTSLSSQLLLLLQNGIGIFNITNKATSLSPALWISYQTLCLVTKNQPLAYIKFIKMIQQESNKIIIQLGTVQRSMEVGILFRVSQWSSQEQTIYQFIGIDDDIFQYQQYDNCLNTVHSQSQRYQQLIVKICNYQPRAYGVFSNLITINNSSSNSLIQFYNSTKSNPSRIDIIHSNTLSHHDFIIRNNTMIVGSLFNMLCYYELRSSNQWKISRQNNVEEDQICNAVLQISNMHYIMNIRVNVFSMGDNVRMNYWSIPGLYVQRAVIVAVVAQFIWIVVKKRREDRKERTKNTRNTNRLNSSRFEVMVKINSKKMI